MCHHHSWLSSSSSLFKISWDDGFLCVFVVQQITLNYPINNLIITFSSVSSQSRNRYQCQGPSWVREFFHLPMTSTTIVVHKKECSVKNKKNRKQIVVKINFPFRHKKKRANISSNSCSIECFRLNKKARPLLSFCRCHKKYCREKNWKFSKEIRKLSRGFS